MQNSASSFQRWLDDGVVGNSTRRAIPSLIHFDWPRRFPGRGQSGFRALGIQGLRARQSDFRPALRVLVWNLGNKRESVYFLTASFLLAAQRAFISWDRRFRPAGVRPPFFCPRTVVAVPALSAFTLAQRARAAAAILARVAADIL